MKKNILWMITAGLLLTAALAWGEPAANAGSDNRSTELLYGKISPQPLAVKLSAQDVHVGESIWLTVSGGVEPYVLLTVENKIQVASRGKNTYQVTGMTAGNSGLTIRDSKNNTITKVIKVLPKR